MFINIEGQSTINTDHLCNFLHNGKKVEFYFDTMTARENWNFEDEEKAKAAYLKIQEFVGSKSL